MFKAFSKAIYKHGVCLSYKEILEYYKRGSKGHLSRVLKHLESVGLIERRDNVFCVSPIALKLLDPDPPCPILFLAGGDTALKVAVESGVRPLNWLLSAGRYWGGGVFRGFENDVALVRRLGGILFIDSGAQQFYSKFHGLVYPYTVSQYLDLALRIGANLVATLDLPLDILTPRGLSVERGIQLTAELGAEVVATAEKLGIEDRVVPVLQGYDDPSQWLENLDLYKEHGITPAKFKLWAETLDCSFLCQIVSFYAS